MPRLSWQKPAPDRPSSICEPAAVTLLAAKILLAPLCVVAVSLAGRRWGVAVAGVLGGLPVVAGPILLVETLIHGRGFGADAAAGTLLGLAALTAFVVVYGRVAVAAGPVPSVLCGWTAFLLGVAVLSLVQPPPALSLVLVAACFALGLRLLPPAPSPPPAAAAPPWWDLPARALAALGLVLTLTAVSGALGPHLSGLLAPFPIITSVLAVFTHAHGGVAQVGVLLRNFLSASTASPPSASCSRSPCPRWRPPPPSASRRRRRSPCRRRPSPALAPPARALDSVEQASRLVSYSPALRSQRPTSPGSPSAASASA